MPLKGVRIGGKFYFNMVKVKMFVYLKFQMISTKIDRIRTEKGIHLTEEYSKKIS